MNRPLSHGGHFESQETKKLCFCMSSLALYERLDVQNLLFQHCVIKVYGVYVHTCISILLQAIPRLDFRRSLVSGPPLPGTTAVSLGEKRRLLSQTEADNGAKAICVSCVVLIVSLLFVFFLI